MKNKFKFIGLIAIVILAGFSMTVCEPDYDTINLTIVNNTGYRIDDLYVSFSSAIRWGSSKLGENEFIEIGESKTITLSEAGIYDIRLVDEDEDSYTKKGLTIDSSQTVVFTFEDFDESSIDDDND